MSTPHDVRYRVIRLMKVHDRSKLPKVNAVLDSNVGKEEELIAKCVTKYGSEPPEEPLKERIERYFKACQPNRVGEAAQLAAKYAGRSQEAMSILVKKHGPEPDPPTPRSTSPQDSQQSAPHQAENSEDHRKRLSRYYQHYCPEKGEAEVNKAIEKYSLSGQFDKMWRTLESKYGPESAIPSESQDKKTNSEKIQGDFTDERRRLTRFYQHYCPEKGESEVSKAVEKYGAAGQFDKMWKSLESKYGPESAIPSAERGAASQPPLPETDNQRKRLVRYYQHYCPDKNEVDVDKAIEKYSATGNFQKMWQILEAKYGPESAVPSMSATGAVALPVVVTKPNAAVDAHKDRLRRFYSKYAPEKTDEDVAAAVERYSKSPGGFEQMWATLEQKYGPEEVLHSVDLVIKSEPKAMSEFDPAADKSWLTPVLQDHLRRLFAFYANYVPEKSAEDVTRTLHRFTKSIGGVSEMWVQLQSKYGPEPADPNAAPSIRDRLRKFFSHYAPERKDEADALIKKHGSTPQGFEEMWAALERRYGPEDFNDPNAKPRQFNIAKPRFTITPLLRPTATIDDDPQPLKVRKAADLARLGSSTKQLVPQQAVVGSGVVVLHVMVKLFGAEFLLYERAPPEKRSKFRDALESDVALNSNLQARCVRVVRLTAGSGLFCEVDIELPPNAEPEAVTGALLSRISTGSCTCAAIRDSYRKDLGGNPVQLFFEDLTVLAGLSRSHPLQALVTNGKPLFTVTEESTAKKPLLIAPDLMNELADRRSASRVTGQANQPTSTPTQTRLSDQWSPAPSRQQISSPFLQSLWESNNGATTITQAGRSPPAIAPYSQPQQILNPLASTDLSRQTVLQNQFSSSPAQVQRQPRTNFSDIVSALKF
ncbi:Hypothetical protein, putative [Bodo saltans]|uniref:Uncharacterized protein n=1 Tax=Bodo saltans TaxID=75058 RepID=A0A0S4JM30_BODSA|nr:Hypothetical protein, putative [Bodo saltans]|eukprot:CUG91189.1 Hypothetical protein, putative [Bodo saltans]